jgi:zinc/manganese transport system substrate-binding protein
MSTSRMLAALATLALVLVLSPRAASADLRVVATTSDLAAIAREIGSDHVTVEALALHTQDPHFVDARPHLALALARADLLLSVGLDLEVGWLPTLLTGSRNGDIQVGAHGNLDCSALVQLLEVPTRRVDRSMGDIHPGGNPHYLFDPRRAKHVARGIAARMAELDPDNAADYRARVASFVRRLAAAQQRVERSLSALRDQKVVAYHRSFAYLADWLGFEVVSRLEPRPGIPPNPRHVAQVLTQARREGITLVIQETYYPTSTSQVVADRAGARLVRLPGGPDFRGGESYLDFIAAVGRALEAGR